MDLFNAETQTEELLRLYDMHEDFLAFDDDASSSSHSRTYIPREYAAAEQRLLNDYFGDNPKYPGRNFRRRYRMSRRLFLKIVKGIINYNVHPIPEHLKFFRSRPDCIGKMSIHPIMKCMAAIRQLAYGTTRDAFDEYLQIGERCSNDSLDHFTKCIWDLYSKEYLRKPSPNDIMRLYEKHENYHGFPGMLGSIDFMHWEWAKCPNAFKAQFQQRDHRHPTIMLEAVASQDLWILHAFFGISGANNDLNVLYRSNLFDDLIDDRAPEAPFTVNGHTYTKGYYLADGIYPTWSTFVKSYKITRNHGDIHFKRAQECAREDVEHVGII